MHRLYKLDFKTIDKEKIKTITFLDPDYIYIPYKQDINLTKIHKNELINGYKSSISGYLVGLKMGVFNNLYNNAFIIANDFKELERKNNKKMKITLENIKRVLLDNNDIELLNKFKIDNIDNIVVSAINDEVNVYNKMYLLKENISIYLDLIDELRMLFKCSNNYLVIKNNESFIIDECLNVIGTYPSITLTLVEDLYLLENKDFLLDKLNITGNTLYLTIDDIDKLCKYLILIDNTTNIITITDNVTCKIIRCKKYTLLSDILNYTYPKLKNYHIIVNGLMRGFEIDNPTYYILTDDIISIHLIKKLPKYNTECLNCGKCIAVCPVDVNPIKGINLDKCIDCGLCTFFCPASINLREKIKGDNHE